MSTVPKLVKDDHTGVLNCEVRMKEYRPIYLPGGLLAESYPSHLQSGHASWCGENDGERERNLVDTKVESESQEGH